MNSDFTLRVQIGIYVLDTRAAESPKCKDLLFRLLKVNCICFFNFILYGIKKNENLCVQVAIFENVEVGIE